MKKKIIIVSLIIALLAILGGTIYYILKNEKPPTSLTLYGNVDVRLVEIGFRVSGQVDKLHFEEGDIIKKGELMTSLDRTPYDSQLKEASANVEAIRVNLKNAEILLNRRMELIGIGGVSQEDLDNALANRNQLEANLKETEAALTAALDNLSYTEAYAPTDGIILTRIREPGTVVNPGDPIYSLSVSSPVWIRAFIDEPNLGEVYYGMPAKVYTDVKGRPVYKGQVGFISPVAEFTPKSVETTQLRTDLVYRLRIYVDNPDHYLLQGMPVTVKLKLKKSGKRKDE